MITENPKEKRKKKKGEESYLRKKSDQLSPTSCRQVIPQAPSLPPKSYQARHSAASLVRPSRLLCTAKSSTRQPSRLIAIVAASKP
ncbi:hypothetical protein L484_005130 [Morus notabilis]|uniref:Uncharacterized protein n=1 Tax=Morus notabilis TaxID=981085 RepID=W9QFE5_9ROSA|nr:hypothetical protein L484_005130 [Morus notabilis]